MTRGYFIVGKTTKLDLTPKCLQEAQKKKKKNLRLNYKGPSTYNKTQGKPVLLSIYLLSQFLTNFFSIFNR